MWRGRLLIPDQVAESVSVTPIPNYAERSTASFVDFIAMKRFGERVNLNPCLTPVAFRDTIVCFEDSPKRSYKSETRYVPKVRPQKFSDTLVIFPKRPQKSFVTYLDYHIDECRRWFKTTMEFKARTYTTERIVGDAALDSEGEVSQSSSDNEADDLNKVVPEDGPGASSLFLPRWNKDGSAMEDMQLPRLVNGEIIMNGF